MFVSKLLRIWDASVGTSPRASTSFELTQEHVKVRLGDCNWSLLWQGNAVRQGCDVVSGTLVSSLIVIGQAREAFSKPQMHPDTAEK